MESYKLSVDEEKLVTEEELHALRESYKKDQAEHVAEVMQENGLGDTNLEITYHDKGYGSNWSYKKIKGILDGKAIEIELASPGEGYVGGGYSGSIDGKTLSGRVAQDLFYQIESNNLAFDFSDKAFKRYVEEQRKGRQDDYEDEQKRQGDALAGGVIDKLRLKHFEAEFDRQEGVDDSLDY